MISTDTRKTKSKPQGAQTLWMPNAAPRHVFVAAILLSLLLIAVTAILATHQPHLGIQWRPSPDDNGLIVKRAETAHGIRPGTRILAIGGHGIPPVILNNEMLLEDPDQYPTYKAYNRFFDLQGQLMKAVSPDDFTLFSAQGPNYILSASPNRALSQLPAAFWLLNTSSSLCFLISVGVWCYRRGEPAARLLGLTGFGFFISMLCLSVYGSRELVMSPSLFRALSITNHLFIGLFCYSLLVLFSYYPLRIGNRTMTSGAYLVLLAVWANQSLQWVEMPVHAYYGLIHIVPYILAIIIGHIQWRKTRKRPVERTALRWFLLSILISIGVSGAMFIIPGLTGEFISMPLWVPAFFILLMFICFAFGILRYGLFNLERWWFAGWVWLASGLLIAGIDTLIILIFNIGYNHLFPLSILALGWIYFPIRQWLWNRLVKADERHLEVQLPQLVQALSSSGSVESFLNQWPTLLEHIYTPLNIVSIESEANAVTVNRHGLIMQIPSPNGGRAYCLTGNRQGTRLFGRRDIRLAESMLNLGNAILSITNRIKDVQHQGAAKERERIMRDLHDDVLPKLITIKQRSTPPVTELSDSAFQSLRDTIYLLKNTAEKDLEAIVAEWRAETAERLERTAIKLKWRQPEQFGNSTLPPRHQINCGRILREAVSNIIKHAGAKEMEISFTFEYNHASITIRDNGTGFPQRNHALFKGVGTSNMKMRAREINGTIHWKKNNNLPHPWTSGMTVELAFPLIDNGSIKMEQQHDDATQERANAPDTPAGR